MVIYKFANFRLDGDMGYGKGFDADVNFNNFDIVEIVNIVQ